MRESCVSVLSFFSRASLRLWHRPDVACMHAGKEWPLSLSQLEPASVAFGQQHPRSSVERERHMTHHDDDATWHIIICFSSYPFFHLNDVLHAFSWWHVCMFFSPNNPSGQVNLAGPKFLVTLTRRWVCRGVVRQKNRCSKTPAFVYAFFCLFVFLRYIVRNNSRRRRCAFLDSL